MVFGCVFCCGEKVVDHIVESVDQVDAKADFIKLGALPEEGNNKHAFVEGNLEAKGNGFSADHEASDTTSPGNSSPAEADGSSSSKVSTKSPYMFEFRIRKETPDETLGFDVKHLGDRLEVVYILPDSPLERANAAYKAKSPPEEMLQVGDNIKRVNGLKMKDDQMVAEMRKSEELRLEVHRG